ncbi:MAG: hypothetical protein AB7I13_13020, partial [Vicinamibacterales bacterium]
MIRHWALAAVALAVVALVAAFGGWSGVAYLAIYALSTIPGWPLGWLVWGRGHPAAWITGATLGYGLTSVSLWIPVAAGVAAPWSFALSWLLVAALTWGLGRRAARQPAPGLPVWCRKTTLGLALVVAIVPVLVALPYGRIGTIDDQGNRRYRAYFTADFVWHEALTAELSRFSSPPRNPYLATQPLRYYWSYFLLPATAAGLWPGARPAPIETLLVVNGVGTGMLLVATMFLVAWMAVPRAGPAAAATILAVVASSGEGLYATIELLRRGTPLAALRGLNIDAISSWWFQALSVDGLQRAIWYTPQHSMAYALGLVALALVARHGASMAATAAAVAGLSLGLSLMMSPFSGGALTLVYGLAVLWNAFPRPKDLGRAVLGQVPAVVMVVAALIWCVVNRTFEGAGGAVAFGLSSRSARTTPLVLLLAVGPVLVPAVVGALVAAVRRFPREMRPALVGVATALGLAYGVTLVLEDIWIGWRAGHLLLALSPGLMALALAAGVDRLGPALVSACCVLPLAAGLPTTVIDLYNAQDTAFDAMGPGFRWTVVLSPDEQDALAWLATETPPDAVVQMSIGPRGRETWSLVPSFARRRMAAGRPISLLRMPAYDEASTRADSMYSVTDAHRAWQIARGLGVDYVYVGAVERQAFAEGLSFDQRPDLFRPLFS